MAKRSFMRLCRIAIGSEKEISLAGRREHFIHFWYFVGRSFVQNRCLVRASALSYTTLLALIPLLAIAISVTSSLLKKEGEQEIYKAIDKFVSQVVPPATMAAEQAARGSTNEPAASGPVDTNAVALPAEPDHTRKTVQNEAAQYIHQFIHNTRSGALGVTGMALLIFVAISMLNNVESAFNDIWGVTKGRNWLMRVLRFWAAISLGPLLIAVALGLAGGSHFQATKDFLQTSPVVGRLLLQAGTLVFIWLAFTLIYQFVPNTKVQFSAALAGGVLGGTLWHLNNVFGFLYVSRVVTNSKIYGSLGLVPVFMAGLYLSWAILLFGAEIAYAFQNRKIYLQEKMIEAINQRDREILALRIMTCLGRHFQNGEKPANVQEIADELEIPTRLAQQILQTLLCAQIAAEVAGNAGYVPARPLESINAHDILLAVRCSGAQEMDAPRKLAGQEVLGEFEKIEDAERAAAAPVTLSTLVQRTQKAS